MIRDDLSKIKFLVLKNKFATKVSSHIFKFLSLSIFKNKRLCLAYDSKKLQDGIGAQLQRIISIKALSETLACSYQHNFISDFDEAVFNNYDTDRKKTLIDSWKNLLNLKDTKFRFSLTLKYSPNHFVSLLVLRFITKVTFIRIRLLIALPSPLLDKQPQLYKFCGNYLKKKDFKKNSKVQIVVHIRRGEVLLSQFHDRYLPYDYYENIVACVVEALVFFKIEYELHVLIESITNPVLSKNSDKVQNSLQANPANPFLKSLADGNFELLDEILMEDSYPFLLSGNLIRNNNAFSDFKLMCAADILLISKSSFSFTAGLLNEGALKIYHPFWHKPSDDWVADDMIQGSTLSTVGVWLKNRNL